MCPGNGGTLSPYPSVLDQVQMDRAYVFYASRQRYNGIDWIAR